MWEPSAMLIGFEGLQEICSSMLDTGIREAIFGQGMGVA